MHSWTISTFRFKYIKKENVFCFFVLLIFFFFFSTILHAQTNWKGGAGVWNDGGNWTSGVPTSTTDTTIDSTGDVTLNANGSVQNFTIDTGGSLSFNNAIDLAFYGTTFSNSGSAIMNGTSSATDFILVNDVTMTGGVLTFNGTQSRMFGSGAARVFTNQGTLDGFGKFGENLNFGFDNQNLIEANVASSTLIVDPSAASTNTGTMRATGADATLRLNTATYTNVGGTIESTLGGVVEFSGATVKGGTIESLGTGKNKIVTTLTLDATGGNDITLSGVNALVANNGADSIWSGGVYNLNGTYRSDGIGSGLTDLLIVGDATIAPTGTNTGSILLNGPSRRILNSGSASTLTLGSGMTVTGDGSAVYLGTGTSLSVVIAAGAKIEAIKSGTTFYIDGLSTAGSFVNNGTIEANSFGVARLMSGYYSGSGTINAAADSTVEYNGGTLDGNSGLTLTGPGSNNVIAGVTLDNITIDNTTLTVLSSGDLFPKTGTVTLANGAKINLDNVANIDFNINLNDVTVTGAGTLEMEGGSRILGGGAASSLTIDPGVTLTGAGTGTKVVGNNSIGTITNKGLVTESTGLMVIDPAPTFTNTGTGMVSITGTGIGQLNAGTFSGGTFQGTGGGVVRLTGATIGGATATILKGNINTSSSATIDSTGGGVIFDTATYTQNGGVDVVYNGGTHTLTNSTITHLNGSNTDATFVGANTFTGTGTIDLVGGARWLGSTGTLTIDSGITILGSGTGTHQIGVNQLDGFTNNGLVNGTEGLTLIDLNGIWTNSGTGTIRASSTGNVQLNAGTFTGGTIEAVGGSSVINLSAATIGGASATTLKGNINNISSSTIIDGTTSNVIFDGGTYTQNAGIDQIFKGTINLINGSTLEIADAVTANNDLRYTDGTTLTGGVSGGTLELGKFGRAFGSGAASLSIGVDLVLGESAQLGVNLSSPSITFNSGGRLYADPGAGKTATLDPSGLYDFDPGSTLQVASGSLVVNTATSAVIDGAVQVNNGAVLDINGTNDITGTGNVTIDAGGTIDLGAIDFGTAGSAGNWIVNGSVVLAGTTVNTGNLTLGSTASMTIGSGFVVDGDFTFSGTDETVWGFDDPSAVLTMTGGVGATEVTSYANLEIGGEDWGTDPAPGTVVGAAAGFIDNFDIAKLELGIGAKVNLSDLVDNGNRIEHGFGTDEALYVDVLEFLDTTSILNLNGKHLYYNSIIGDVAQIIDTTVVYTDWTDGVNDAGTPFNSGVVGTLPAFEIDWTGVGDIGTSGDASILAVGSPFALPGSEWAYVTTAGGDVVAYSITPTTAVTSGSFMFSVDTAGLVLPNGQDLASLYLYKDGVQLFPVSSVDGTVVTFLTPSTFSEFSLVANPEPTTLLLITTGLLGLLPFRRKK